MKKLLLILGAALLLVGLALLGAGAAHLGQAPGKLTWDNPEFRSALMTFAYKVYGNPKMEDGRHFLSKIIFKNAGQRPVTDFAISYKLQDYIPWTDPETMPSIPPGFSFAKLYYPRLPAEVTRLHSPTTCALQVKVQWKEDGRAHEQTFKHDVLLRAVNELTYCDLPASEVETWYDAFDTSDFATAMVTPNDPVVSAYAAQITKLAGGTTAGIAGGKEELIRICRATYDYMCRTGLRYTGDTGVPANFDDVRTSAQIVRMPRDVILNNNGLCIELAILWASVLQHLGVDAALVMVPGHCYVIAYSEGQRVPLVDGIPIECTSITPRAVGSKADFISFDESVQMSAKATENYLKQGLYQFLPVAAYQARGFTPPELPEVDVAKITETLEKRMPANAPVVNEARLAQNAPTGNEQGGAELPQQQMPVPAQTLPTQSAGRNSIHWQHPMGYVNIDFPSNFRSFTPPINPGNVLVLVAGNPATTTECDVMHVTGTEDPGMALQYITRSAARYKIRLKVASSRNGENGLVFYQGTTNNNGNPTRWLAVGKPVPNGVVFVTAGVAEAAWNTQYNNLLNLMNNVHFK